VFATVALSSSLAPTKGRTIMGGDGYEIVQFPALRDNYGFLIHDTKSKATAAIDTPQVEPILEALRAKNWELTHIFNTHHHHDHAGGNAELCSKFSQVQVVAPFLEKEKIGRVDQAVKGGDIIKLGALTFHIIDVGGHTLGHIAYFCPQAEAAFVGDAIFAMGCGRMFEGTYPQFTESLKRISSLPDDTALYCAHEYTMANAKFALSVDPQNPHLIARAKEVESKRANNIPTVPTTLALEKLTNPFIRFDALRAELNLPPDSSDVDVFAALRKAKDSF